MRRWDHLWEQTRSTRGFEPDPPPFGRIGSSDVDDASQAHTNRVDVSERYHTHHTMAMASAELMAYCYGELAAAYARCAAAARGAAVGEAIPLHDAPVVFEQAKVRRTWPYHEGMPQARTRAWEKEEEKQTRPTTATERTHACSGKEKP